MSRSVAEKRAAFRALHTAGCFVLPNPWDAGSARYLESLGFSALATTSSGFAWSRARADGTSSRDQVLAHLQEIAAATDLPVNADFEDGYGATPDAVADSVRLAVGTGVAGLSIEDASDGRVHDLEGAVHRLAAARAAIDATGEDVLLVGRAESFLYGGTDLDEVVERLRAYARAGADCVYAPGVSAPDQVGSLVRAVAPTPLNVLIGGSGGPTVADVAAFGVRRVSVGGALARAAWGGFTRAARMLAAEGRFDAFADATSGADLNALFSAP